MVRGADQPQHNDRHREGGQIDDEGRAEPEVEKEKEDEDVDTDAMTSAERVKYLAQERAESKAERNKNEQKEIAAFTQPDFWVASAYRNGESIEELKDALFASFFALLPLFLAARATVRAVVAVDRLTGKGAALDPALATLDLCERLYGA